MNQAIYPYPLRRIGIIGGGQLGKMTAQVAKRMGFYVTILDPHPHCAAHTVVDQVIVGSLYDADKLQALAETSEVITFDVEHIDAQVLQHLAQQGHQIFPSPYVLAIIQDKLKQKQILAQHGIPVPAYQQVDELTPDLLATMSLPVVQKARQGGYDGKGVVVLFSIADHHKILPKPSVVEQFIHFDKELAIMVARDQQGNVACYPVVEMVFDDKTNICDIVAAPANIAAEIATQARDIAVRAVEALEGVGIFGVEMFLTPQGEILVNEIAPRPHNSGHYTIEACVTCQFEQLVRILSHLPLGATDLLRPAVMLNLLGEEGYQGTPMVEGLAQALSTAGLTFHFYGKEMTQPFRKMGHITLMDESVSQALEKIHQVKQVLKIVGREKIK